MRDLLFFAPFECKFTTATVASGHQSRSAREARWRKQTGSRGRWQAFFLLLTSYSIPCLLSGCVGGTLDSFHATPTTVSFGAIPLGQTASMPVALVNQLSTAVQVSQINISGQQFQASVATDLPITVAAGGTYNFNVNFSPTVAGAVTGQVTITSNLLADGTIVIGLSGSGTAVNASNATGTANLESLSCESGSITGLGIDNCTVALSAAAPSGGFTFSLVSNNAAVTVPATVTVPAGASSGSFAASVIAVSTAQTATLTATSGGTTETYAIQLGAAGSALTLQSNSVAFGNVILDNPAYQSVTLTSSGAEPLNISAGALTGTGFAMSGVNFPLTLEPGQAATLEIGFDPLAAGAASGAVTLTSNSTTGATATISLSGIGESGVAVAYAVNLSWDAPANSSDPVAGYIVYRSSIISGAYEELNSSAVTQTSFVDNTAQDGLTYDYIVESIDASGNTSGPSNMASATIP